MSKKLKNSLSVFLGILIFGFLLPQDTNAAKVTKKIHKTFSLEYGGDVSVENTNGNIIITTWDKKSVDIVGGQTELASALGTSQSVVWRWVQRRQAPAKYIRKISALTKNKITIEQLLSDHENKEK